MAQIKVLESRRFPSMRPDRAGQQDTLLVIQVDGKAEQVYAVTVYSPTPTDAEIQVAARDAIKARDNLLGKTLTI